MKLAVLYLLFLKAMVTTFSGTASLAVLREDVVVRQGLLTDRDLNLAVTAGRSAPGPNGIYLVSVGYLVAGVPGAFVGWLAMVTPAFLVIPFVRLVGARADRPRLLGAIRASTAASAGLLVAAMVPIARGALTDALLVAVAALSFGVFSFTRIDSAWVMVAAAVVGLLAATLAIR